MCKMHWRLAFFTLLISLSLSISSNAAAGLVKGIYLTQTTLEDTAYLTYLIQKAKAVGISTFVVDMEIPSKKYQKNIQLLKENNIHYVARIIVFPTGGHPEQIVSEPYWEKRFKLVQTALNYGADEIQLDYIRYNTKQPASIDNSKKVLRVVQFFRDRIPANIPLQADVFGISSFGESKHIGQNLKMMATSVNALCPMVYPSHFEPYRIHAVTPYETIYGSIKALHRQFDNKMPVKVYAYIEISNYRYPLSGEKRRAYVLAQMKAVRDSGADGWFVWSAHNKYDYLFNLLGEPAGKEASTEGTRTADTASPVPAYFLKEPVQESAKATTAPAAITAEMPHALAAPGMLAAKYPTSIHDIKDNFPLTWPLDSKRLHYPS